MSIFTPCLKPKFRKRHDRILLSNLKYLKFNYLETFTDSFSFDLYFVWSFLSLYHKCKMPHCLPISFDLRKGLRRKKRFIVENKYLSYKLWCYFQMAKNKRASEKGEVPCIYLRLEAFTPIQSEVYQTRWQENQHLLSFSNLAFSPTCRTLGSYFCRHHNVHDDIITVLAKVVHNWGHFVSKSVTLWIITGVV